MMTPQSRFCLLFDLIGATGLTAAAAALFAERWLTVAPDAALFQMSFISLSIAVGAFISARVAQMAIIIATTPDPVAQRVAKPVSVNVPTALPTAVATQATDFQRAA